MSYADQTCMGCQQKKWADGGWVFQCYLRLCQGCHSALGGTEGVVAMSRTIEERVAEHRASVVHELMKEYLRTGRKP